MSEYREFYSRSISFASGADFALKILVRTDHDCQDGDERHAMYRAAELIEEAVLCSAKTLDPKTQEESVANRDQIVGLFDAPIFVEEIPNGYCPRWCCKHLPWFVVTTKIGRIKIGRRKRVISIEWDKASGIDGDVLFASENVTKGPQLVHAWGAEKAREYIAALMAAQVSTPSGGLGSARSFQEGRR